MQNGGRIRPESIRLKDGTTPPASNVVPIRDSLHNVISGMGTTTDQRTYTHHYARHLSDHEIDQAYRGSAYMRKAIDKPATEMVREWRDWQADSADIEKLEAEEKRLDLRNKVRKAEILRGLGGGGMVLYVPDTDQMQPLNPATITGLDVAMFTQPADVADPVQATTTWQGALADDVHHSIKAKLTAALLVGGIAAADAKARAADVIAKARRRAANIGVDQTGKLSRAMDRDRREAAGVGSYMWVHSPHVVHPRAWHLARNGQTFTNDEIAEDDRAGVPFGCQCYEIPVLG